MFGLAFLAGLVSTDDADPRFGETLAAFYTLSLAHDAMRLRPITRQGLHVVRRLIASAKSLEPGVMRLRTILSAIELVAAGENDDAHTIVAGRVFTYGVFLHEARRYDLAIDTFDAILKAPLCDLEMRMQAQLRRAFACRLASRLDDAELSYTELRRIATERNSDAMIIEADYGLARVVWHRGNMPEWERLITALTPRIEASGEPSLVERIYLDRAAIAGMQGAFVDAINYSRLALNGMNNSARRIRTQANVAVALRELGQHASAVALCETLIPIASESDVLASFLSTRYHLAIDVDDWVTTKRLRRAMKSVRSSPVGEIAYCEVAGREFAQRNRFGVARRLIEKMVFIASSSGASERVIWADKAIADIAAGRVPVRYIFAPNRVTHEEERAVRDFVASLTAKERSLAGAG